MKNKVFFSVFNGSSEDQLNHDATIATLKRLGIDCKRINGKYKGVSESSILVDSSKIGLVDYIARQFAQESILKIDDQGIAWLHYMSGKIEPIGKITQVLAREALSQPNYSEVDGQYYIVK